MFHEDVPKMFTRTFVYKTGKWFTWRCWKVSVKVTFDDEEEMMGLRWRDLEIPTHNGWSKKDVKIHRIMEEAKAKAAAKAEKLRKECLASL